MREAHIKESALRRLKSAGRFAARERMWTDVKAATGKSIWDGIAIGRLRWFQKREVQAQSISGLTPEEELERFEQARARAQAQLRSLHESAVGEVGEDNAAIFEIHQMMLEDEDFLDAVRSVIRTQRGTAEHAVQVTGENFAAAFAAMEDTYMQARAADVRDVAHRLQAVLAGAEEKPDWDEPFILMADDLSPSETVQLDKRKLRGFVTRGGSTNSHTAILARTMGIPALVGVEADPAWDGRMAVLDGYNQCLYVDPAPSLLTAMEARRRADAEQASLLQGLKKKPNVTLDGTEIQVFANIGSDADVGLALQNDAQGIGLFRSEFLYLNSGHPPTEEEQLAVYRRVVETMAGKKVVIRTLDIGADKQADYFGLEKEENPALGYRAIGLPGHPHLPDPQGAVQNTAEGHPPRQRLRDGGRHVSHDHLRAGGEGRQGAAGGLPQGADRPGLSYGPGGGGDHGGDPRRRDDRRRTGPGGGLLLPGHQRPGPVHPGHRPAEPQA